MPQHSLPGDVHDQNGEGVISAARVFCFCRFGSGAAELFSSIMKHFKHREKPSFVLFFFFDWLMFFGRPDGNRVEQGAVFHLALALEP